MRYFMQFPLIISVCVTTQLAFAQTRIGPKGPYNPEARIPPPEERIFSREILLSPAAAPEPVLKYSLYPRADELKPGNSVPMWYRAIQSLPDSKAITDLADEVSRKAEAGEPFPAEQVRSLLGSSKWTLDATHEAYLRQNTVWDMQLSQLRGRDTIEVSLGEFQEARQLARLLSLKTKLHIHEGDFDAALREIRTSLRLARDVAEAESIIQNLIGIAIQAITFENIELLVSQPDAPNLYWALAALPDPLINIRTSLEFEMTLPERYFPWLKDADTVERSAEEWQAIIVETVRESASYLDAIPGIRVDTPDGEFELAILAYLQQQYPAAKELLLDRGYTEQQVEEMPVAKAIALRELFLYRRYSQLAYGNTLLPMVESQKRYDAIRGELQSIAQNSIFDELLPAVQQVYVAAERRDTFRNAVMVVEAIRMHMAEHGGEVPMTLDEITIVPVPKFTFTNEPFGYEVGSDALILDVPVPNFHVRYVLKR